MKWWIGAVGCLLLACRIGSASVSTDCARDTQQRCITPLASLTPGVIDPAVTQTNIHQTICVPGYSSRMRPPVQYTTPVKRKLLLAYHTFGAIKTYELDHLVSLELGGAPRDVRNLWPEPWDGIYGAHRKDRLENMLHRSVCTGKISLEYAQRCLMLDWRMCKP